MTDPSDDYESMKAIESFERLRRPERRPKSSAQLISRLIARRGFSQIESNEELRTAWNEIVPRELVAKTQATVIKRGTLQVVANSSAAIQQLTFTQKELLRRMQEKLPQAGIRALKFRTGRI